tara:strand:- start:81 stop:473 length:393 start_codon:yes stop_codon:yes gene_type:complete
MFLAIRAALVVVVQVALLHLTTRIPVVLEELVFKYPPHLEILNLVLVDKDQHPHQHQMDLIHRVDSGLLVAAEEEQNMVVLVVDKVEVVLVHHMQEQVLVDLELEVLELQQEKILDLVVEVVQVINHKIG